MKKQNDKTKQKTLGSKRNIKHKKMRSIGIGGSRHNANNDNKQFSIINWITMKILNFLILLGIVQIPVNNNQNFQDKKNSNEKSLDFDQLAKNLENGGWI